MRKGHLSVHPPVDFAVFCFLRPCVLKLQVERVEAHSEPVEPDRAVHLLDGIAIVNLSL